MNNMDNTSFQPYLLLIGLALLSSCVAQPQVTRIGNEPDTANTAANSGNIVFLLNDGELPKGVLFAFKAYFLRIKPVRFQVWRKVTQANGTGQFYRLIGETRYTPTVEGDKETIYISSQLTGNCILTEAGDRLAVFEEGDKGSVGYRFNTDQTRVLRYVIGNNSVPDVGSTIEFGTLTFPYVFAVAAYVDLNWPDYTALPNNPDATQCKPDLLINDLVAPSTRPPLTGAPGATGPIGPQGPQGFIGPRGEQGATGPQGPLGPLGPAGPSGPAGPLGPIGATGSTGPLGPMGITGPRGDKGATGARGPPGPPGQKGEPVADSVTFVGGDFFSDPLTVLILLIWLGIVSVLLILILILVVTMRRRRAQQAKDADVERRKLKEAEDFRSPFGSTGGVTTTPGVGDTPHDWMGTMKEDSEAGYSNDTIIVDGKRRSRRHHMNNNQTNAKDDPEMTSTMRTETSTPYKPYQQPPDITASSQPPPPPLSPINSPSSPTSGNDFPFENEISTTTDTITRRYDNEGNLSQDNLHMIE